MKLQMKVLLMIAIVAMGMIAAMWKLGGKTTDKETEEAGFLAAKSVADTVVTMRQTYTTFVVATVNAQQNKHKDALGVDRIKPNFDFRVKEKTPTTIPLPASMVKDLGETLGNETQGAKLKLYSLEPFPHREKDPKPDDTEVDVIKRFRADANLKEWKTVEEVNGRRSVRYFLPDKMAQGCVNCHNNVGGVRPDSPKTDWKVNDVRGVVEVIVPVDTLAKASDEGTYLLIYIAGGSVIFLIIIAVLIMGKTVVSPFMALAAGTKRVEDGDLTAVQSLEPLKSRADEVGAVATATVGLLEKMRKVIRELKESNEQIVSTAHEAKDNPVAKRVLRHAEIQKEVLNRFTV